MGVCAYEGGSDDSWPPAAPKPAVEPKPAVAKTKKAAKAAVKQTDGS